MHRRDMFTALGVVVATAGAVTTAQAQDPKSGKKAHPDHHGHDACAQACSDCQLECFTCRKHCEDLVLDGHKAHAVTMRLCDDCADICGVCAEICARQGALESVIRDACAKACDTCADACEKFADDQHMQRCAIACRKCAEECRKAE